MHIEHIAMYVNDLEKAGAFCLSFHIKNPPDFICKNYEQLDENQQFYLHKSIAGLKSNQPAQNPITYLSPQIADTP